MTKTTPSALSLNRFGAADNADAVKVVVTKDGTDVRLGTKAVVTPVAAMNSALTEQSVFIVVLRCLLFVESVVVFFRFVRRTKGKSVVKE